MTFAVDTCLCPEFAELPGQFLAFLDLEVTEVLSQADLLRTFLRLIVPVLLPVPVLDTTFVSMDTMTFSAGSNAILLNFRFRFVLGRWTGEKFSLTESVSTLISFFLFKALDVVSI